MNSLKNRLRVTDVGEKKPYRYQGVRGGTNWDTGIDIYTHYNIYNR